ncbi:MAG: hypothetical protein MPK62_01455 [Alphaproteobacteria bacterium]|nr:hypothetical protein [Alphaproteobacteria bacterium]MDA8029801.1 hypothetical protein [Alphaproteobacteria bacterium]
MAKLSRLTTKALVSIFTDVWGPGKLYTPENLPYSTHENHGYWKVENSYKWPDGQRDALAPMGIYFDHSHHIKEGIYKIYFGLDRSRWP